MEGRSLSYSRVRERFAEVLDEVESSREPTVITRRGREDMALIPAAELSALRETAYLLRSPANAMRLLAALARSRGRTGRKTELEALRAQLESDDVSASAPGRRKRADPAKARRAKRAR